ncbi:MAG: hypothetical protein K8T89_05675 [Planctomycetes bacterium]|nr:hypothetical protein [Planctomycetota bacterium]
MNRPYDVTSKDLLEISPADWLAWLGQPRPPELVRAIDADVSTISMSADKVLFVDDPSPWILHIEFQSSRDAELPLRAMVYQILLRHRHGVPVVTVLLLLREQADGPELTGELELSAPLGRSWAFRYEIVRLWQQPVELFLKGPPCLIPFAPLAAVDEGTLPRVISEMKKQIENVHPETQARKLWAACTILMGMRYSTEVIDKVLPIMINLKDSSTYWLIHDQAVAEGLQTGRQEGRQEGLQAGQEIGVVRGRAEQSQATILRLGLKKFGPPPEGAMAKVSAFDDQIKLNALVERILDVNSWEELLAGQ